MRNNDSSDKSREDREQFEKLREEYRELQDKFDFLLAAMDYLPNPIFMKDSDGRFLFFNKAYSEFFEMNREKYIGKTALDLDYLPMSDRQRFHDDAMKLIENAEQLTYEANFVSSDGMDRPSFYWSRGFCDEHTDRHGLVGEIVDISKERELQDKLQVMAETDHASGLFNRTVMWKKGAESIKHTSNSPDQTCLVMIDLDHFKNINDEFGHLKGDETLSSFAEILQDECRHNDVPIRYGGDEFLLILQNINMENAVKVAERISSRAEKELILPDGRSVTASIGIIEIDENENFETNLSRLDRYLYKAKEQGRNCIVIEEPAPASK